MTWLGLFHYPMLWDATNAGNEASDAVNKFHRKFLEAYYKAGMLTATQAPFNCICQGIVNFHVTNIQTKKLAFQTIDYASYNKVIH